MEEYQMAQKNPALKHITNEDELVKYTNEVLTKFGMSSLDEPFEYAINFYHQMSVVGFFSGLSFLASKSESNTINKRVFNILGFKDETEAEFGESLSTHLISIGGISPSDNSKRTNYLKNLFFSTNYFDKVEFESYILFLCIYVIRVTKKHPDIFDEHFNGNILNVINQMFDEAKQRFLTKYLSIKYSHKRLPERFRFLVAKTVKDPNSIDIETITLNVSVDLAYCAEVFIKNPDMFAPYFDFSKTIVSLPEEFGEYNIDSFFEVLFEGKYFSEKDIYKLFFVGLILYSRFIQLESSNFPTDKYKYEEIFLNFFKQKGDEFKMWEFACTKLIDMEELNNRFPITLPPKINSSNKKVFMPSTEETTLDSNELSFGLKMSEEYIKTGVIDKLNPTNINNTDPVREFNASAIKLFNQGNFKEAINIFTLALEIESENTEILFNRGQSYFKLNEFTSAIDDYTKTLSINPKSEMAYYQRGNCYSLLDEHSNAISDFNTVITLNQKNYEAYFNRANGKMDLGDFLGAVKDYNAVLTLNPNHAGAFYNRALTYRNLNNFSSAIDDYSDNILLDPNNAEAYHNRGHCKRKLGDHNGAIADFSSAIAKNPRHTLAYNSRGLQKADYLSDYNAAIADYNMAIAIDPKFSIAYYNRAISKSNLNDFLGAIQDYSMVITLDPNDGDAFMERGTTKLIIGDKDGAINDFKKAYNLGKSEALEFINR
ncbi:MAG: tetratricopeptide repeat protein [Chitinophagaceae bacterium]|nr:tetratricopeptide repeat protein [Chitinophagaceae bacterium]